MDIQTGLICLVLVIVSGAVLLFISMFGMREKTYEEAIAEQRRMPKEALLLGRPSKETKNKKQKRQGKKVKEKLSNSSKVVNSKKASVKTKLLSGKAKLKSSKAETREKDGGNLPNLPEMTELLVNGVGAPVKNVKKDKVKPVPVKKPEPASGKLAKANQKDLTVNNYIAEIIPKDELKVKSNDKKNNPSINNSNKDENYNENAGVKGLKVKEKAGPKVPLKEISSNVDMNEKNLQNGGKTVKDSKNIKTKTEKKENDKVKTESKVNSNKTEKVKAEKSKEETVKAEKVKETKVKNEMGNGKNGKGSKGDKVKGESQVQQQQDDPQQQVQAQAQQQQQPKQQSEAKQVKMEVNYMVTPVDKVSGPVLKNKFTVNQPQMNNREAKNKKIMKNEFISLQQMTEKDGVNINLLIPLIRKAELSRTEVQLLTDILLTKHLDEVSDQFEWIEGRQDPVAKLKKQLAEKEKALSEEQQASHAFQNKLKELRSEYNSERARLTQACRQYDENILAKQGEIQNLHATNRHLVDSHMAEKQALTQKIQQLQAQINDESLMIRKLQEDHNQTQNALQQELVNQGQQMEIHIGRLSEQLQEAQKNFEAQIHSKIQEAEQIRASFNAELQKNRRQEEELRELREQQLQSQNKMKSLESRASQLKECSNHTQELVRQVEELQRANKDLELRYNSSHKSEEDLKFERNKLQSEVQGCTSKILELQSEYEKLLKEREKMAAQVAATADLEKDFLRMREENQCLISQVSSFNKIEREAQQLREENENLAAQVTAFTERPAADGRENGDSPYADEKQNINVEFINHESDGKQKDVVIERLADELKQKEVQVEKLSSQLDGCQSEITRLSSEVAKYKTEMPKLKDALEEQRSKNNDLRKKNWKAMEALAATEKSLEISVRESEKSLETRLREEQESTRNLLERIFPTIKLDEKVHEKWMKAFEKNAKTHLEDLKDTGDKSTEFDSAYVDELESKNNQLQTLVVHYKKIIEDTEGMLNKLQNNVEQEEIRWRQQYETLEPQAQMLKEKLAAAESRNDKLESKVKELERKCNGVDGAERRPADKDEDESEKCKKLSEEIEALSSKLAGEESKNKELNKEIAKLRGTVKFGQDAYVEENKKRRQLEDELNLLKNGSIGEVTVNSSGDFLANEKGDL